MRLVGRAPSQAVKARRTVKPRTAWSAKKARQDLPLAPGFSRVPTVRQMGKPFQRFSHPFISQSALGEVCAYIANQEEHHRKKTFAMELKQFVERYELKWNENEEENR